MNFLLAILAAWTVVKVSDGDTVWVKDGGERVKVAAERGLREAENLRKSIVAEAFQTEKLE